MSDLGTTRAKDRIANGLCPRCGKESAPYYLCASCRFGNKITHVLKRAERLGGGFKSEKRGRDLYWSIGNETALRAIKWRDVKASDGRHSPRIRGVPVNVEETIIKIMMGQGKPCTLDEIVSAWGRLRASRDGSIVANVRTIIESKRRREEKLKRRAARFHGVRSP